MKNNLFLAITLVVIFVSCKKASREEIVRQNVKDYVEKNLNKGTSYVPLQFDSIMPVTLADSAKAIAAECLVPLWDLLQERLDAGDHLTELSAKMPKTEEDQRQLEKAVQDTLRLWNDYNAINIKLKSLDLLERNPEAQKKTTGYKVKHRMKIIYATGFRNVSHEFYLDKSYNVTESDMKIKK